MRFASNIENALKVSVVDNIVHHSPVYGGWQRNDYAISDNLLIDPWTGLPSIALVNDPLAGELLQVNGDFLNVFPPCCFTVELHFFYY